MPFSGFRRITGVFAAVCLIASAAFTADTTAPVSAAVTWLNAHQNANGSWGSDTSLVPQNTARVVLAQARFGLTGQAVASGAAWLSNQNSETANQFLAEKVLALVAVKADTSGALAHLALQKSRISSDFGSSAEHSGDTYDSALVLEALATNFAEYPTAVAGLITTLVVRQNPDGGWGLERGFDSDPLITAEVLFALSSVKQNLPPPATIDAAQQYFIRRIAADGSIGSSPLETATALRALARSGVNLGTQGPLAVQFLISRQSAAGSWDDDVYTTARVLEALSVNKPNVVVRASDIEFTPSPVGFGGTVAVRITIHNTGTLDFPYGYWWTVLASGVQIASGRQNRLDPGGSETFTVNVTADQLVGALPITVVADATSGVDEVFEDDNSATANLTVLARADLRVYASDILIAPTRPQPNQAAAMSFTVRNDGGSDANAVRCRVFDRTASGEAFLQELLVDHLAAGSAEVKSVSATLSTGTHALRVVVDPDNTVAESSESNNEATRSVTVTPVSSVDLRITSVASSVTRPVAGQQITISVSVENSGTDPVASTVAVYDGVPSAGGTVIGTAAIKLDLQSQALLSFTYIVQPGTRVIYAVADPGNSVAETDEANNQAYALLTDQFTDLEIARDGFVLPRVLSGWPVIASGRVVIRNVGPIAADSVRFVVYDDLPESGGVIVHESTVSVPAFGKTVVPVSWPVRAGQHFATAVINPDRTAAEPNYVNNLRSTYYSGSGSGGDLAPTGVDLAEVQISKSDLSISGIARITITYLTNARAVILFFEDIDGDDAYNPNVDNALGSTSFASSSAGYGQVVGVPIAGTLTSAPGKLMAYVDATNAIPEQDEHNNLLNVYNGCYSASISTTPYVKWSVPSDTSTLSPVARIYDSNGDEVIDRFDPVMVVDAGRGSITLRRGDTGAPVWTVDLDHRGRQVSPAVGDLDGDGKPEIVAHFNTADDHKLVALNGDGTIKWTSNQLDRDPQWEFWLAVGGYEGDYRYSYGGAPLIADLDQDGFAEVVTGRTCLDGRTGTVKWIGAGGAGRNWDKSGATDPYREYFPDQEAPIAIDVDGDGKLDVIAGNTVYRADGSILWYRSDLPDGYVAPLYLDGVDVILVAAGNVYRLNGRTGATIWGPKPIPNGALLGGAPTVGYSSIIGVAGDNYYSAFNAADGSVRWTTKVSDIPLPASAECELRPPGDVCKVRPTHTNAASYFELSSRELAYASRDKFVFLDLFSGNVLYQMPIVNRAFYPACPTIADIDDDGHADILVPGQNLQALTNLEWNATRTVFNEFSYHIGNVSNDSAAIPRVEPYVWFSGNGFHLNEWWAPASRPMPNLTASYLRVDTSNYPASARLAVRIGNVGSTAARPTRVAFFRASTTGAATLVGTADCPAVPVGGSVDVTLTISAPPAGAASFYAVADSDGASGLLAECSESDNTTETVAATFASDVIVNQAGLSFNDPLPRPGDTVRFSAYAQISGAPPAAPLLARFYLGDPAVGGVPISNDIPATVATERRTTSALVVFDWVVNASSGRQSVYVVFDPANALAEDREDNNLGVYAIDVSTSDAQRRIEGVVTVSPLAVEAGKPVTLSLFLQNTGNVALEPFTLQYDITGPSAHHGAVAVGSVAKGNYVSIVLGSFTPGADGTYTAIVSSTDPTLTVNVPPGALKVAPFAGASVTSTPSRVPLTSPIVQALLHVSRLNTVNRPEDPLIAILKTHVQKGSNWMAQALSLNLGSNCYLCHVHANSMIAFEKSRNIEGISIDETVEGANFREITTFVEPGNGHIFGGSGGYAGAEVSAASAAWALSFWRDGVAARPYLEKLVDGLLPLQQPDGHFVNTLWSRPVYNEPYVTMMAMVGMAHANSMTHDPRYEAALGRAVSWCLAYDYRTRPDAPDLAALVSIGLSESAPYIADPSLAAAAAVRARDINLYLRTLQNPDGTFGTSSTQLDNVIIPNAQCLYALAVGGIPTDDPGFRNAVTWLLNHQQSNGSWVPGTTPLDSFHQNLIDDTTWVMIALPAAFERFGRFDVDFKFVAPSSTVLGERNVPPFSTRATPDGNELTWRFYNLSEGGQDLYFNLELGGLANNETRTIGTAASISYADPYTGEAISRPVSLPSVTGYSAAGLTLSTDKPSYSTNENVAITETIENAGIAGQASTNEISIRDGAGNTTATVASETLAELPSNRFPGWNFRLPAHAAAPSEVSRELAVDLDFASVLAQIGATGTWDRNSLRVSLDAAPAPELYYTWYPASGSAGKLVVRMPETIAAGQTFDFSIYFDVVENGFKPVSMYDRSIAGPAVGQGIAADYYGLDIAHIASVSQPENLVFFQPPFLSTIHLTPDIGTQAPSQVPAGLWGTIWDGSLYVTDAGTYRFLLGSDEGSWLSIDGQQVIDNGGFHGVREVTREVALAPGFHTLKVTMFNWNGPYALYLKWAPPGLGFQQIPPSRLYPVAPSQSAISFDRGEQLPRASTTRTFMWNTGSTAAGTYTVGAVVRQSGSLIGTAYAPFTIAPQASLAATITTDKIAYDSTDSVHVSADVQYVTGNTPLTNCVAVLSIETGSGAVLVSTQSPLATLVPGQVTPVRFDWTVGAAVPQSYVASIVVKGASGSTLAQARSPFQVRSSAQTGNGIGGQLALAASPIAGVDVRYDVTVVNGGNAPLADAPFAVRLLDQSQTLRGEASFNATVAIGASYAAAVGHAGVPPGDYTAYLVSLITGQPVVLASLPVQVKIRPQVAAAIAADKTAYDVGDTAHVTGTITYTTGDMPLTTLSATITIADAGSAIVATSTTAISSLSPNGSATVPFDWAVGVSAPGTYTAKIVVTDTAGVAIGAQAEVSLTTISTAVSGKGITGQLTVPAFVYAGDPIGIHAGVTDNGNAAIADAPFEVRFTDAASTVVATQPFQGTVAIGATYTTDLTQLSAALPVGNYTATLVSLITGQPVVLASAPLQVKVRPQVGASIVTDKPSYDVGDTAHVTGTITYTTGDVPLTTLNATTTIVDANAATIATRTSAIASLQPNGTANVLFDWAVGVSAPGTYTAKIIVIDTNGVAVGAQASTPFSVTSTAVSGKGITGQLTAPAFVYAGDSIDLQVQVIDGGNAAIVEAPFQVRLTDAAATVVATQSFTASVAIGATRTTTLAQTTAGLPPGNYTLTLVSMITGQPVLLATTAIQIKVRPQVAATLATDKASYDVGDTAHVTGTITYPTGDVPLTTLSATTTVVDANAATLATQTTAIASLQPNGTVSVPFDWAVGVSAPGTYTAKIVVTDTAGVAIGAQAEVQFSITSTAVSGKGITGQLTASASVFAGDPVAFTATILNNGNSSIVDAPFQLQFAGATQAFTASVAMGGSATKSLSVSTVGIAPGNYTATLLSAIPPIPITLAAAPVQIRIRPQFAATLAADRSTFDAGEVAHLAGAVQFVTGDFTLTNGSATIAITGPSGPMASTTIPIASLQPGQSAPVAYDWPVGISAPGPYTATVTARDANAALLATASASFTVRATSESGAGITGRLTLPATVNQGDVLSFSASISNAGNSAISNAAFEVRFFDAAQAGAGTTPFTATVAMGATQLSDLSRTTNGLATGIYQAQLVSLITAPPVVLATGTFEVKPPPLALDLTLGGPPRVLIWANCASGNSTKACTPVPPPFITATLSDMATTLVGDQYSFMAKMRTGAYNAALIYEPGAYETKIANEYLESIRNGFGLLFVDSDPDAMPKLAPALATTFISRHTAESTLLDLLASPFTTSGQLTFNGDFVDIAAAGSQTAAKVAATQAAAITYNTFAGGHVVVIPFDLEKTATAAVESLLDRVLTYVSRAPTRDARQVVVLDFKVTPPPAGSSDLTVSVALPAGMQVVDAVPALTSTAPPKWTFTASEPRHFYLWVRLPETIGTYAIDGSAAFTGQLPVVQKSATVQVIASRTAIEDALGGDLAALQATAPATDQPAIATAQSELTTLRGLSPTDQSGALAAIDHVMNIISQLQTLSVDVTAARNDAGRLLLYWQSRTTN